MTNEQIAIHQEVVKELESDAYVCNMNYQTRLTNLTTLASAIITRITFTQDKGNNLVNYTRDIARTAKELYRELEYQPKPKANNEHI
jgi:hypothetical protein